MSLPPSNIGRVLALIYTPVVSLVEDFFYDIKIRVHFMGKEIQLATETFGIEFIRKLLRFCGIADFEERIIVHSVMDVVCLEHILHHFPTVNVDLDEEGKPGLNFNMHETEMFILKIQVKVLAFAVDGNQIQKSVVLFLAQKTAMLTLPWIFKLNNYISYFFIHPPPF